MLRTFRTAIDGANFNHHAKVRRPARWTLLLLAVALACLPATRAAAQQQQPMRPANFGAPEPEKGNWLSRRMPWNKDAKPSSSYSREPMRQRDVSPRQKREGQFALGRLAEKRDQLEAAESIYAALIKKYPEDSRSYHRLGVIAAQAGDVAKAEQLIRKAGQLNPEDPEVLRDLGYLYYKQDKLDEAEQIFKQGLAVAPKHQGIANNYAMLLAEAKMYKDALELFKRANEPAEAYANMGFMLAQMGHLDKAEKYFSHALTLDNELKPAAHGLMQVVSLRQRAEAMRAHELKLAEQDGQPEEQAPAQAQAERPSRQIARAALSDDGGAGEQTPRAASRIAVAPAPAEDKVQVVTRVESSNQAPPPPAKRLVPQRVGTSHLKKSSQSSAVDALHSRVPGPARRGNPIRIRSTSDAAPASPTVPAKPAVDAPSGRRADQPAPSTTSSVQRPLPSLASLRAQTSAGKPQSPDGLRPADSFDWTTSRFSTALPSWTPQSDPAKTQQPLPAAK